MKNRLNQGGSADIMKTAMVMAWDEGIFDILIPHVTVHDELVCSVPKTWEGLDAVKRLRNVMEHAIELNIPIIAEPELGKDWYHVDTRYARETSKGIELVGAERFTEGSEAKPVKTKKGVVMFEEGKVLLRDLDGNEAVVTESFFDKNFKEVA